MSTSSSRTTLSELQNKLQNTTIIGIWDGTAIIEDPDNSYIASSQITKFLSNPNSESDWDIMNLLIQEYLNNYSSSFPGLTVSISLSDGRVAYDSTAGLLNTFANYQTGTISENINSRLVIQQALLSRTGIGFESKYSNNKTANRDSMGYTATRMGLSTSNSLGCTRVGYMLS
jgi:hypothetical protein